MILGKNFNSVYLLQRCITTIMRLVLNFLVFTLSPFETKLIEVHT